MMADVTIIGGGLAGSEAAYQAARLGVRVRLLEMKPKRFSPAHKREGLAELVCSNSLKSEAHTGASGLLKEEMRSLGSLIIRAAENTRVPAGKALAVDRVKFSAYITDAIEAAGVEVVREEVTVIPEARPLVIATGPLTSDALAAALEGLLGSGSLYFFDAISPIIYKETIDMTRAFRGSRYDSGVGDYINCPMDRACYERFVEELAHAGRRALRPFEETPFFEGCLPVETLADRGPDTLAYGPMKPVGLVDPVSGRRPHAVVQLRRENLEDTIYNMVGFQTRLTYGEQKRVFKTIPGLENASFARLGSVHRNSYIDSPRLLLPTLQLAADSKVLFAGQITGVEGYCESTATGLVAGINAARFSLGLDPVVPPATTMTGALLKYVTTAGPDKFQPMNANFGLLPGPGGRRKKAEKARTALGDIHVWVNKILATSKRI